MFLDNVHTMDEETLILEVQNLQIIYDPSHPFYKDNFKKGMAWKTVAGVIGVDVDVCKAKWRTLRDSFVKNRRKVLVSGSEVGSQKEWKYTDLMSFIVPHLQPRRSKRNLSRVLAKEERSSTPGSMSGSDEPGPSSASVAQDSQGPQTVSPLPSPSLSGPTTSGVRDRPHRSRSPRERVPQGCTDTRRSHRPQTAGVEERPPSNLQEPLDESYHFAMSLVPLLLRLDHNRRQQAKIGILNLLQNIDSSTASWQQLVEHSS